MDFSFLPQSHSEKMKEKNTVSSKLAPWEAVLEVLEVISCAERRRINELTLHQDEALRL